MIVSPFQILDVDLASSEKRALLLHCQQVALVGDREEPERTDVFDRADEAEIDLAVFQPADDVVGRAAGNVQLDIGILSADAGHRM